MSALLLSDLEAGPSRKPRVRPDPGLMAGRVWHNGSAQPYLPDGMRKVLFLGYGYRWLRPRDNMTVRAKSPCFQHEVPTWGVLCEQVGHFMERSAPIVRAMPMPPLSGAHELTPNALPLAPPAARRVDFRAGLHLAQRRGRPAPVSPRRRLSCCAAFPRWLRVHTGGAVLSGLGSRRGWTKKLCVPARSSSASSRAPRGSRAS